MPTEAERLREAMVAMDQRLTAQIAEHSTWMKVHDVDCGRRYDALKAAVVSNHKITMVALALLFAVAVGLKSKFGEEILRVFGLL